MDRTHFRGAFGPFHPRARRSSPTHQQTRPNRGKTNEEGGPPGRDGPAGTRAISAEEGLYLHIPWPTASADDLTVRLAADVRAFSTAFREVWREIPPQVRCLLLTYWRGCTATGVNHTGGAQVTPHPRPVIRLACEDEQPEGAVSIRHQGRELAFRADVITEPRERARAVITRALAEVYRIANRDYGTLLECLYLKPLEDWEREHFEASTDEQYDAVQASLETAFLKRHVAAVDRVVRRWGFAVEAA